MAARSIWSGSISFGLVNVPVKLFSATNEKSVHFHQISGKTGARVKQKRVDSSTGEEVQFEDIVKGYELSSDHYVTITPDELEAIAPKQTKMIGIETFVDEGEIDPISYANSYYVGPADTSAGTGKAYRLLTGAMEATGKVGIGRIILRTKEQLVALRVADGVLRCSTLVWADEINRVDKIVDLDEVPGEASEQEVQMAEMLISTLSGEWDPSKYQDQYREQVLSMIERKAAGEVIEAPAEDAPAPPAPDLMAALTASLEATKTGTDGTDTAKKPAAKKPAARKAAKTKAAA